MFDDAGVWSGTQVRVVLEVLRTKQLPGGQGPLVVLNLVIHSIVPVGRNVVLRVLSGVQIRGERRQRRLVIVDSVVVERVGDGYLRRIRVTRDLQPVVAPLRGSGARHNQFLRLDLSARARDIRGSGVTRGYTAHLLLRAFSTHHEERDIRIVFILVLGNDLRPFPTGAGRAPRRLEDRHGAAVQLTAVSWIGQGPIVAKVDAVSVARDPRRAAIACGASMFIDRIVKAEELEDRTIQEDRVAGLVIVIVRARYGRESILEEIRRLGCVLVRRRRGDGLTSPEGRNVHLIRRNRMAIVNRRDGVGIGVRRRARGVDTVARRVVLAVVKDDLAAASVRDLLDRMLEAGPRVVILNRHAPGVHAILREDAAILYPRHVPSPKAEVVLAIRVLSRWGI